MTPEEIKSVVAEVLKEQKVLSENDVDFVAIKTISTILNSFGIEEDDRKEFNADLRHLRKWRKSVEQAQSLTFKVAITAIISGLLGALWMGAKAMLGK
jgi:hypothetical protein